MSFLFYLQYFCGKIICKLWGMNKGKNDMYYASIGFLSLVLHLIINHEVIANKNKSKRQEVTARYRQFLFGLILYYLADCLWGFFTDLDIVFLSYADTVLYFFSMTLSVLLWVRYVVAYIDRKGLKSTSLLTQDMLFSACPSVLS